MLYFYRSIVLKGILLLALFTSVGAYGQTDVTIGTGTVTNTDWVFPCPLQDSKMAARSQYLYKASELTAAGMTPGNINAIRFNVTSLGDYMTLDDTVENVIIKIGTTSSGSLTTTAWETGTQQVYGPQTVKATVGINSFTFSTPFFWNGVDNIVIEMCTDQTPGGNTSANPYITQTTNLTFNGSHTISDNYNGSMCDELGASYQQGGNMTSRPNIVFNYTPAAPCTTAGLTGGTTVSNKASVCTGEGFKLTLSGASLATGLTYQWQSSSNNSTWTNITGATGASFETTQTVSTYYHCIVTCSAGGNATSGSVQVLTPLPIQGVFTIDKTQPASATNFQSFRDAYNFIKCGINGKVTFNVAANSGIYNEQVVLNDVPGSSVTNTITFNGATGASVEFAPSTTLERWIFKLDGADYFVFNNLTVTATGTSTSFYGYPFLLTNDADSNVINGCTISTLSHDYSSNFTAILVGSNATNPTGTGNAACDGNIFSNNTIKGGLYGITIVGSSTIANGNNKILRNAITDFGRTGIYLANSFNTQIDSNTISRPTTTASPSEINGIYVTGLTTRLAVTRNTITRLVATNGTTDNTYGIRFETAPGVGGLENVVSNNLLYNYNGGNNVYGIWNSLSHNTLYYHNTVSLDGAGTGNTDEYFATAFYESEATGLQVINNNFVVTRAGVATNTAIWFNTPVGDIVSDYNNLYVSSGLGKRQMGYHNGAVQLFLPDWKASTGSDAHSVTVDPRFVDLANGNLHPQHQALDNVGSNIGITADIVGVARNVNAPDPGAFEFTPPACTAPPVPGTTVISATGLCEGLSVALSLNGNSIGAGQLYQWQTAANVGGPWLPLGTASSSDVYSFKATTSAYYRVAVTCSGNTAYSNPVFLTVSMSLPAGTYTIDKNTAPSATNFTSFSAAVDAMACGIGGAVVFNVAPNSGTYTEQVIIPAIGNASSVNTITFNGNGNTLNFSGTTNDQRAVLKLRGADHLIIDSLVITATGTSYGYGVQLLNDADSNVIRRSVIRTSTTSTSDEFSGIVISASDTDPLGTGDTWCDGNLFERNTITGGYYGITLVGDPVYFSWSSNFILYNKVLNNTFNDFYSKGVYMIGTWNTRIEGNTFSRPTRTGVAAFYGVHADQTNGKFMVLKNKFTNPFGGNTASTQAFYGFYGDYAGHDTASYIANNAFYNINGSGGQYAFYLNGGQNLHFYHNTINFDSKALPLTSTVGTYGMYQGGATGDVYFKNNIVHITRSGIGNKYAYYVSNGDVVMLTMDNNIYNIKGTVNNYIGYRNANRVTLKDWQDAVHRDLKTLTLDPVFKDVATGNLEPTIAPVNDKGTPVGIADDINGLVRSNTTPDIGAWEFAPEPCISGVTAGTASATPNSNICLGAAIALHLTGNTTSGYQKYIWQFATAAGGPWTDISDSLNVPDFTATATASGYYRAVVTCTGITATSAPVQVTLNAPLPAGTYTVGAGAGFNYPSFTAAVAALQCGIGGNIIFNIAPGTYTEQIYMRKIGGAGINSRVTFQSANGNPASVILTTSATSANNYTLKLDSASYITYKNMTITATNTTYSRVIELAGTASYDSLVNNVITTTVAAVTTNTRIAIFASPLKGDYNVIKGNTITNGASAIYVAGTTTGRNNRITITDNTISGYYQYGIYSAVGNPTIAGNSITVTAPKNTTSYAIWAGSSDSGYVVKNNQVTISNTTGTVYGIYGTGLNSTADSLRTFEGNKVIGVTGITSTLYGMYFTGVQNALILNNVVSIKTSAANSYGLYSTAIVNSSVFNNTVYSTATSTGNNYAAYFTDNYDDRQYADIRNNVFAHGGGGKAIYLSNTDRFLSNYNLLYTSGAMLGTNGFEGDFATLPEWIASTGMDLNSIVYEPALLSATNPAPDVNAPGVWAMHGRGVQLGMSDHDINNNTRPTSLKAGVPDLGAYEFVPASVPPVATATPAAPAPGERQTFMMGTDTVAAITWGATVPAGVTVKRYTGTVPPVLAAGTDYMYFYVDADVTGAGNYDYKMEQFYLDPWRGFIDNEARIRLGKTDNAGLWTVDATGTVNTADNIITQSGLTYMDKFTGLTNPTIAYPATDSVKTDTSNLGTRFWTAFGQSYIQYTDVFNVRMVGGDNDADVTVKIYGTNFVRNYHVPAHTAVISDAIPRNGVNGAYLNGEGLFDRGVLIESTEPIAAFVHTKGSSGLPGDGSTMLLPVGAMGFDYYALSWSQPNFFSLNIHSWFYVIADHDSTLIEITPTVKTAAGRPAGVPFKVTLQKGQVYQVMGAEFTENEALDIAGTHVRSISNASGKCYPIAVFSGNSFGLVDCGENFVPSGNFMIQQNFPTVAWGTQYITAPTSRKDDAKLAQANYFRILVKDPGTVVKVNGTTLTGLNNNFYQYQSATADLIEADKPIQVAMFMPGPSNYCDNGGNGPEMFFLIPANMGVRKAAFYSDRLGSDFSTNYLTVIVPTAKLATLQVDGSTTFDHIYAHPNKTGYSVAVKRWGGQDGSHIVESDTTFTAMSYGMIGNNSYGVNVGAQLPNLAAKPGITNIYDSTGTYSDFNCIGTPYKYSVLLPVQPTSITWKFTKATGVVPTADSVQMAPVSTGSQVIGGKTYFRYDVKGAYLFATTGDYKVPVEYVYPAIDNCDHNAETVLNIKVVAKPVIDFAVDYTNCVNDLAKFTPSLTAQAGDVLDKTYWNFGNSTTSTTNTPTIQYAATSTYTVKLDIITREGCITNTSKQVVVKEVAPVEFVSDTVKGCPDSEVTLTIKNPQTGVSYNWYDAETNGSLVKTGNSLTISKLTATTVYYVASSLNGCVSKPRKKVVAMFLPAIGVPVVTVDSVGVHTVRYTWTAVPGVTVYQVSTDGGVTWTAPSSGAAGLSHTITGLGGSKQVTLRVKAVDPNGCKDGIPADVQALTLPDMVFLPSAFTPNGDGLNDVFKIETAARSMHMMVFNQWGEKVFESSDIAKGWDGYFKGKLQPSGTYMYVCEVVLIDGTKEVKKGSVSLVR